MADKSEAVVDVKCNQSTIRTHMEGKLVDCEPLVISLLAAHSRKPNLQVVLDTGNRSGYNLISANVVSRYKLKRCKRKPLGLRTFNDVKTTSIMKSRYDFHYPSFHMKMKLITLLLN